MSSQETKLWPHKPEVGMGTPLFLTPSLHGEISLSREPLQFLSTPPSVTFWVTAETQQGKVSGRACRCSPSHHHSFRNHNPLTDTRFVWHPVITNPLPHTQTPGAQPRGLSWKTGRWQQVVVLKLGGVCGTIKVVPGLAPDRKVTSLQWTHIRSGYQQCILCKS